MMISKKEVLEKAIAAVADRQIHYDDPIDNFRRIALLWHTHLCNRYRNHSIPVLDPADVSTMMILVKLARLEYDPTHLDSWTDAAGYAACGAHCTVKIDNETTSSPPDLTESEFRWVDGSEYQWGVSTLYDNIPDWYATGRHQPGLTNTPRRGERLGERAR